MSRENKHIILFDGVCNLCNNAIQVIIKHDPTAQFTFTSLQGDKGKELLNLYEINPKEVDSIILIENDNAYIKSTAALRIARKLNKAYPLLYVFIIVPKPLRNAIYSYIAKNRYKWFGKKDKCMIPTPELKSRFIT